MNDIFPMYYSPDEEEFKQLWDNCIFVFDANVLLNLYRYSIKTSDLILLIMNQLSDRIWIPYQVALEYQANRHKVIYEQKAAYTQVKSIINKSFEELLNRLATDLNKYNKRHPIIEVGSITTNVEKLKTEVIDKLEEQEKNHPNHNEQDKIREVIDISFYGKVGPPYSQDRLDEIYREGEKRYKLKQPPGFKDLNEKKDQRRFHKGLTIESQYGDLIVWKQILDMAKERNKSVILITDDGKEDWWQKESGRIVGSRVELTDEFMYSTKQNFYMYESYRFIEYAQKYLNQQVDRDAIAEAQNLKKSNDSLDSNFDVMEKFLELYNDARELEQTKHTEEKGKYNVNDQVLHYKWGLGIIKKVIGGGDDQELHIEFPHPIGFKRLLSSFAVLEKIYYPNENNVV
ncbi:PIN domain-containing protein [Paenibacillus sp. FSL R5-0749]|uniref:PIN-like domain-containing protein n=1 Tax=Paenibacillus sp. FSL R5-0749 TaxID=2921657 RepID=UPI003159B377